ncbi:MAG: type I DNA topoisomerase [Bacteroidales bacterium]|jgi:DNA topoisomerase-1|nr:type I DNA topoisomerase [Bacteroidales bacterium]
MSGNLVIVESPAKAKTIGKFLGSDFVVASSMGHIRDLEKKGLAVDLAHGYTPKYVITDDKKKVVAELKQQAAKADAVWLASDEDREGEAIAWHLADVLHLDPATTKRIVFHEITRDAIVNAVKTPRSIDFNLVNAQQARRVLDRIVGFEVSPVLWHKVKPALSAGRVQSVAVRLIVDREREIFNFQVQSAYRVTALFLTDNSELAAELNRRFDTKEAAADFLQKCIDAVFTVADIATKPTRRTPAAPFTTSTLQQEASRKLGFSVSQTMTVAQRLYESGKITYMRTDSVNLSDMAMAAAKAAIIAIMGEKYYKRRQYQTKTKGAQEAHEAIRPTDMTRDNITGTAPEKRLYNLIWKRTVASQMADAEMERTTINIKSSKSPELFQAVGEVIKFDGFLKVYMESSDNEDDSAEAKEILPAVQVGQILHLDSASATERFTQKPPRYSEASLVKKLEEQGIGRPSTYAPTITTIQNRGYIVKDDRAGTERHYTQLSLKDAQIIERILKETTGAEKAKLFPTDIGIVVNDFLMKYFPRIMDYNFTANVEVELDEIAAGKLVWNKVIDEFYHPFHENVEAAMEHSERMKGERMLGKDPETGKPVIVKIGRYGPVAQIGEGSDADDKPRYASLRPGQILENLTLEEVLDLFKLPREIGTYEGKKVSASIGRFGPYILHNSKFVSLPKTDDPYSVNLERAIELIEAKREKDQNSLLKTFEAEPDLRVINGRFGAYINFRKKNYKLPKGTDIPTLTLDDCKKIIGEAPDVPAKTATKKTATKKTTAKATTKTATKKAATKKTATKKTSAAKK